MGDAKSAYSDISRDFVDNKTVESSEAMREYEKSKNRERLHGDDWRQYPANLNDVVEEFAADHTIRYEHGKIIYSGERYNVIADMSAGYLRIYDKEKRAYVKLDGAPGTVRETHFKILRREEM